MEIGEVGERMILLRLLAKENKPRTVKIGNNNEELTKKFDTEKYFLVDLSSNPTSDEDVVVHDLPSLLDTLQYDNASLVADPKRHTIYLIGGKKPCQDVQLMAESIYSQINSKPGSATDFYTGASRLDLKDLKQTIRQSNKDKQPIGQSSCWVPMLITPFEDPCYPVCTALDGCIHNLGRRYAYCFDEKFLKSSLYKEMDDDSDLWETVFTYRKLCNPAFFHQDKGCRWGDFDSLFSRSLIGVERLSDLILATPLLPDPVKMRILVYFPLIEGVQSIEPHLLAYYPYTRCWEHLSCPDDKHPWRFASAVVQNVIYFRTQHKPLVAAYDIDDGKWLNVQWSEAPLYENDGLTFDAIGDMKFQYMLLLANDIFCLISNTTSRLNKDDDETSALPYFLKFRFERKGDTVTLTPMCARVIVIENIMMMLGCTSA